MKRKWKVPIIILVILVLFLIIIWPMAPVWERMGLKPFCIQQEGSKVKIIPCPDQSAVETTSISLPTPGPLGPIPIIVDDDGSPDGMIAMLYFLSNPLFDVRAVTISFGEAHPQEFAQHVAKILSAFGRGDIPIGYGNDQPLEGTNAFPEPWREASDRFWDLNVPQGGSISTPILAADLITHVVSESDQLVTIFVSGSHTNLAEALRLDPGISAHIQDVFIMGGSINVAGNIHSDWPDLENETAEWNIWVDPLAAEAVFTSGLSLHLIPLDATRSVTWTRSDISTWDSAGSPEGILAGNILNWMLDNWSANGVYVWDLVAAIQATSREVCTEEEMGLDIVIEPGHNQGQTQVIPGSNNAAVCLDPLPDKVKAFARAVFNQP